MDTQMVYRCPECSSIDDFVIYAVATVKCNVNDEAEVWDSEQGDIEWNEKSAMRCAACDYDAMVKDFQIEDPQSQLCNDYSAHLQAEIKQARKEDAK